jgi:uncharacterized protein (TIGR02246 family)
MVASVEDRLNIEEAFARYVHAIDEGDAEGWAKLFAPDGAMFVRGQEIKGTDALTAMAKRVFEENSDRLRHCITNILTERVDLTTATARAYGLVTDWKENPVLSLFAVYGVDFQRFEDTWRFKNVRVKLYGTGI